MRRPQRNRPLIVALYLNAALLLAVLLTLLSGGRTPSTLPAAFAADVPASQRIAGGDGVYLMPGQFNERLWGCYVMDVNAKTLCAYQYFTGEKKLRLVASRSFRHDSQLREFNTDNPSPGEVAKLVQMQNGGRADGPPDAAEDAETPEKDGAGAAPEEDR